ncbi:CBS domain-containing protein [Veillonella criceti]|uniref:Putative manganese-dependent inorganic pyrophosphatase n=1 Tax=Veillonella criceti TaxID=103891 RepID=A0A380NNE9_9FIRM|nr:CBS domain-containing protein [Veillonella criceti]SUP44939.1 putative manganese-dependent inorganic pyrophosphatase [Veillonella criceti]
MLIAEAMNKYPVTVTKDTSINEAAKLLVKYKVAALIVVNEENKLEGIITEGDLLYKKVRPHAPHYVNVLGASIYYSGIGEYNAQFKKLLAVHVEELMTKEVITCGPKEEVEPVVATMLEKHLKTMPVLDDNDTVIGVFSRRDVVELIAKES